MPGDKDWSQIFLIGGGIIAAGGIAYYLYSSSSVPQQHGDDNLDGGEETEEQQATQKAASSDNAKPLRNPLPPLPERPAAGKRKAANNKTSAAASSSKDSSKDNSKDVTSSRTRATTKTEAQPDSEPDSVSNGASASKDDSTADSGDEDHVLDWSETADEVIILLAVPTSAQKHEVDYRLKPTHLTVSVQGVRLIQANLSHAVQPEDSTWQFDRFQGMRVMSITLQKATNGAGPADWDKLFLT